MEVSSAVSRFSIAVHPQELQAAINNALQAWAAALRDNSQAPARVQSTPRVLDLQDPADPVLLVDVPDLAPAPALALRVPAALAVRDLLAALRLPARHRGPSAHHRIALAAADSSIPRPRKAQ